MPAPVMSSAVDPRILLEAGTNEVEILVFKVADRLCGVNVAKVREIRNSQPATFLPHSPSAVEGVVRIRDLVVPLVNLRKALWEDDTPSSDPETHLFLEFNNQMVAFKVQDIDRIYRVSWQNFTQLPHCPGLNAPVTGIILIDKKIVTILDFEALGSVLGINGQVPASLQTPGDRPEPHRPRIIYADDSLMIRQMIDDSLGQAGYHDCQGFADGQEAWEYLCSVATEHSEESISHFIGGIISDVEMPRMDGFTLTRKIREHPVLKKLPVVLFSSLISKDNVKKGEQVGATAQVSKPRWEELTQTLLNALDQVVA